jgi:hypothetical protein
LFSFVAQLSLSVVNDSNRQSHRRNYPNVYGCRRLDSWAHQKIGDSADAHAVLPVLKVLGSMFINGEMTLALKDMKVVEDLLKMGTVGSGTINR